MKQNTPTNFKLLDLLSRFIDSGKISPADLKKCNDFLFDNHDLEFSSNDHDLNETILYLKDIMGTNNLYTLDQVFVYFNKKRQKIAGFISHLIAPEKSCHTDIIADFLPMDSNFEIKADQMVSNPLVEKFPLSNDKPKQELLQCTSLSPFVCKADNVTRILVLDGTFEIRPEDQLDTEHLNKKWRKNKNLKINDKVSHRNQSSKKGVHEER